MSVLQVVRHGQASFFKDDYDNLSPLGEEQAHTLGRHWAEAGLGFDHVYLGPRRRHRHTAEAVAAAYRERGLGWPEPELVEELDEHHGMDVVNRELERRAASDPGLAELVRRPPTDPRLYFRHFRDITRGWVRGEVTTPDGLESWADFRHRVTRGFERIFGEVGRGRNAVVFTSGGPAATATGIALGLGDEKVLELSWRVRNTAFVELLFSDEGVALNAFNAVEHLREARLVTYV